MSNEKKRNILIVHRAPYPLRSTVRDSLYSFRNYSDDNIFYLDMFGHFGIPHYIKKIEFDLIIFHTSFMAFRWGSSVEFVQDLFRRCQYFMELNAKKAIMPQDEFLNSNALVEMVNRFNIDFVFTVAPKSEWRKIYEGVDFEKVQFQQILTGYIDERVLKKINDLKKNGVKKSIDIGYRAFKSPAWFGSHGFLKTKIADEFLEATNKSKFKVDISTKKEDTFIGDDWYKFLLKCKYFIGVEGGSTILDPDGEIHLKGSKYIRQNPEATFGEIEKECFEGMDGNVWYIALSPKHLEACITDTCQVLISGEYGGVLKPNVHYIPLNSDFSNLDEVLEKMEDEDLRKRIVKNARIDLVESGKYSFRVQVETIFDFCSTEADKSSSLISIYLFLNKIMEYSRRIRRTSAISFFEDGYVFSIRPRLVGYKSRFLKVFYSD
ncbi:MAG: hypothetical protein IH948_04340 [Bacteroidetes bacterium]|nr:hypothetical protein [Bacteroidota bacterium]